MAFHFLLTNLVASVEDAVAAMFLDNEGEAIEVAGREFSVFEFKVLGAYQAIFLENLTRVCSATVLGAVERYKIQYQNYRFYIATITGGYYLVLIQSATAGEGRAWHQLELARQGIEQEIA